MVPRRICVFSLHPTRDVILEAPELELGRVGRAASWFTYPAGKALNAARTAGRLGTRVRAVVLAPPQWRAMLKDFLGGYSVAVDHLPVAGEGRFCVMLNEKRRETVINTDLKMKVSRADFEAGCVATVFVRPRTGFGVPSANAPERHRKSLILHRITTLPLPACLSINTVQIIVIAP